MTRQEEKDLNQNIGKILALMEEHNKTTQRMITTIYGDGNGQKGLVIKVDRLNVKQKQRDWVIGVISIPIIGKALQFLLEKLHLI